MVFWEVWFSVEKDDRDYLRRFRGTMVPYGLVLLVFAFLSYWVTKPVLASITWAALLSVFSYPLYKWLEGRVFHGKNPTAAALTNTFIVLLVMVLPAIFFVGLLVREGVNLYGMVSEYLAANPEMSFRIEDYLPHWFPQKSAPWQHFLVSFESSIRSGMLWVASHMGNLSRNVIGDAFTTVYLLSVTLMATFFLTRDGHVIVEYLKDITPLGEEERDAFFLRAKKLLRSVVYGVILTAAIQAFLGTLGWAYFDLPAPLIFGFIIFVLAVIPLVGTPLVLIPGAIYLFITGGHIQGVVLGAYSLLVVSTIDSFVRPFFISEGGQMHALVALIGIVGGLAAWGFLGIFLGPLVLSLFIFFLDGYRRIEKIRRSRKIEVS